MDASLDTVSAMMKRSLSAFAVAAAVLVAAGTAFPARAAQLFGIVACNVKVACSGGSNTVGPGVEGDSTQNDGIVGTTSSNSKVTRYGVIGEDLNPTKSSQNSGVYGMSNSGVGVTGSSSSGAGIYGFTYSGLAAVGGLSQTSEGVRGETYAAATGVEGLGHNEGSVAVRATNTSGGTGFESSTTGTAFLAVNPGLGGATVFKVDGRGNVTATSFTCTGSSCAAPKARQKTAAGPDVETYSTQASVASIEDFGESALVNGQASVRLDARFASAMQPGSRYLVFLTPQGSARGELYVAQKGAAGFLVRENAPGRDSVTFDYRIVAQPLGASPQRLPIAPVTQPVRGAGRTRD